MAPGNGDNTSGAEHGASGGQRGVQDLAREDAARADTGQEEGSGAETGGVDSGQGGRGKKPRRSTPRIHYRIAFRPGGRRVGAVARQEDLRPGEAVIVRTDHGPEPAVIVRRLPSLPEDARQPSLTIRRRATRDEEERYARLLVQEEEAFRICAGHIQRLGLPMNLVRVERFFSGNKIIFYFTADNRVDFRELVKALVNEFRVRVEMRQIGVRHETRMIGGIGACGRELCCNSFLRRFDSVSIKMAKEQDLPLNPAKISGLCNRLLCCLTYEFETYKDLKKGMPRAGKTISLDGATYRVVRQLPLQSGLLVRGKDGEERLLSREEWESAEVLRPKPGGQSRGGGASRTRKTSGSRRGKRRRGGKKTKKTPSS